jgi:hypothetical protein
MKVFSCRGFWTFHDIEDVIAFIEDYVGTSTGAAYRSDEFTLAFKGAAL